MVSRFLQHTTVVAILVALLGCDAARQDPTAAVPEIPAVEFKVDYPFEGTVFPSDIAPPTFRWQDTESGSKAWSVTVKFDDAGECLAFMSNSQNWTPTESDWEVIKRRSEQQPARVTIQGEDPCVQSAPLSVASVSFATSEDEVGAPIFYREVNLPFREAVRDPAAHIRWRFGSVSSNQQPPIVLDHLPACGNCHSFSANASVMGMDVDYANDKGSYAICDVNEEVVLDNESIISWGDYKREDDKKTFGLLSQVSPDGRHVISTVKDLSVFRPVDNLTFSQLFFPVKGILCVYSRETKTFAALPGADDADLVQSNPVWSPDGKYVVFARAEAIEVPEERANELGLTQPHEMPDFLKGDRKFQFDLYRVPFNDGRGGEAEPLTGASHNGKSNYFARYSPDGKWIVFCQADSFMLLQPDSELFIIPSQGGEARRLACNQKLMNSWHSWSPNSRWLVFSSKAFTPYTQLFLTHIDDAGESTPPVLLSHFTSPKMAGNIPEFVNAGTNAIEVIRDAFAEDLHYVSEGDEFAMRGLDDMALEKFHKALEINPECAEAYRLWGVLLMSQGKLDEAEQRIRKSIALENYSHYAYWNLAKLLVLRKKPSEAIEAFRTAIELNPHYAPIREDFAQLLLQLGQRSEAKKQISIAKEIGH